MGDEELVQIIAREVRARIRYVCARVYVTCVCDVCIRVYMCVYMCVYVCICVYTPSLCFSVSTSLSLSVSLVYPIYPPIHPSVHPDVYTLSDVGRPLCFPLSCRI